MKVSQSPGVTMIGLELLFSIYKLLFAFFARGSSTKLLRAELTLPKRGSVNGPVGSSAHNNPHAGCVPTSDADTSITIMNSSGLKAES